MNETAFTSLSHCNGTWCGSQLRSGQFTSEPDIGQWAMNDIAIELLRTERGQGCRGGDTRKIECCSRVVGLKQMERGDDGRNDEILLIGRLLGRRERGRIEVAQSIIDHGVKCRLEVVDGRVELERLCHRTCGIGGIEAVIVEDQIGRQRQWVTFGVEDVATCGRCSRVSSTITPRSVTEDRNEPVAGGDVIFGVEEQIEIFTGFREKE